MNIAFVLHLYQPPTQNENDFRKITSECYIPLIKLLNNKSGFTLNTPLSLLEQFEKYGYNDIISSIKDLANQERVELLGSAAYHPLLTKISRQSAEKQIIFNEYALGYYFGQKHGFEGEPSILVRDIKGFFSPEMAINEHLVETLSDLNYEWVLADRPAIDGVTNSSNQIVFQLKDFFTKIIIRDTGLSNILSFKRDFEINDVIDYIMKQSATHENLVVALDGEVFGHHNKEGIFVLETLIDKIEALGLKICTVSQCVKHAEVRKLAEIKESTWGVTKEVDLIYPYWDDPKNNLHKELWTLLKFTEDAFSELKIPVGSEGYESVATWRTDQLNSINPPELKSFLELELLVLKSMHSDQFWWASNKVIADKVLFNKQMIDAALGLYKQLAGFKELENISKQILALCASVEE